MNGTTRALAIIALLAGFAVPAFAAEWVDDGFMSMFAKNGHMYVGKVTDKALLEEIARTGIELPAGTMVAVHDGKAYLVKDIKMSDGKMMSDKVVR